MNKDIFERRLNNFYTFYSCFNRATDSPNLQAISIALLTLLGYDMCSSDIKDYDTKGKYFMVAAGKSRFNRSALKVIAGRSAFSTKFFDDKFDVDSDVVVITDGIIFKFFYKDRNNNILYEKSINGSMLNNFKAESEFLMFLMRNNFDAQNTVLKSLMEVHYD